MKLLFLRGRVPTDRSPKQIMFDNLSDCDDLWTQLAYHMSKDGYGEVWYWGGSRKVKYRDNFVERWVPNFKNYKAQFTPDVIFCRGGFPEYDVVLRRFPKAFKIYYGAGQRFFPRSKFKEYDLFLCDTPQQMEKVKTKTKRRVEMLVKPAADNVFHPREVEKKYDVIFSSNEHKKGIKGHGFILPNFPTDLKMIQTGISSKKTRQKYSYVDFKGWVPRKKLPKFYGQSKMAIVCCTNVDSCPRVIPEAIACGCPVLVLDTVNIWRDRYINSQTGQIASQSNFIDVMRSMIGRYKEYSPYSYYKDNLSLPVAADYLNRIVEGS